jgi:hypothetical protein
MSVQRIFAKTMAILTLAASSACHDPTGGAELDSDHFNTDNFEKIELLKYGESDEYNVTLYNDIPYQEKGGKRLVLSIKSPDNILSPGEVTFADYSVNDDGVHHHSISYHSNPDSEGYHGLSGMMSDSSNYINPSKLTREQAYKNTVGQILKTTTPPSSRAGFWSRLFSL